MGTNKKLTKKASVLNKRKIIVYALTVIFSLVFLIVSNKITSVDFGVFLGRSDFPIEKAKVLEVLDNEKEEYSLDDEVNIVNQKITFSAILKTGDNAGQEIVVIQNIDGLFVSDEKQISKGNLVVIAQYPAEDGNNEWVFNSYYRAGKLLALGIIFAILLIIFGKSKGFNTLVSLGLTCAAIFAVFIPAILSGQNIYLWAILISVFTIVMTLMIVNGPDFKTLAAILGCVGGVLISGLLTIFMSKLMFLTGIVDEDSVHLSQLSTDKPIDLRAIIFAAIIIGALGATMDVAMSVASSLWEMKSQACFSGSKALFRSGINIGRDIMGTMSNTLVLAYIGSSLSTILLLVAYESSMLGLLNFEMIVVEILQALVGIIGILFTIPLTAFVCATLFHEKRPKIAANY